MTEDLFQDEVVRATDLNRSSGDLLNRASRTPITIVRNDESFALMRRDLAAQWKREASSAMHVAEIGVNALRSSEDLAPEYRWISAFDKVTLANMMNELMNAWRQAVRDGDWNEFDAVLHEWSESGWASASEELQEAFTSEKQEVEITDPGLLPEVNE